MTRFHLPIEGMTCAACVKSVSRALTKVSGVSDVSVNLATGIATVLIDRENVDETPLRAAVEAAGYKILTPESSDTHVEIKKRLIFALPLTIAALTLGMTPGIPENIATWGSALTSFPVFFWAGWNIHRKALLNFHHRLITMDTLISLGTTATVVWSTTALFVNETKSYFETAATIITLVLIGRRLEAGARQEAGSALQEIMNLVPETIELADGSQIPSNELSIGDRFIVKPGERVPADGKIYNGTSAIERSIITGEPNPIDVQAGNNLVAGTINTTGVLFVSATCTGSETTPARLARLVAEAQAFRAPVQRLVDRVSEIFVPIVITLSLLTLFGWLLIDKPTSDAVSASVAVLIIACPCALGLATPTALQVGIGKAAQMGILIRSAETIEAARNLTIVVLDKTGTVTEGEMNVVSVSATPGWESEKILSLAASVEKYSEHPIGRAISRSSKIHLPVSKIHALPGFGIYGLIDNQEIKVTRPTNEIPEKLRKSINNTRDTIAVVSVDDLPIGTLLLSDKVRPQANEAIRGLEELGLQIVLLTGDHSTTALEVGRTLGIQEISAELDPKGKLETLKELQSIGNRVAVVGDGLNDVPILAAADLGIVLNSSTDAAFESAGIALIGNDLRKVVDAIALCRKTVSTIRTNLLWAFVYNIAALPMAMLGFLNPIIASIAMVASSLFVVSNSLRLRSFTEWVSN